MHNGLCESSCLKEPKLHRPFLAYEIPSFILILLLQVACAESREETYSVRRVSHGPNSNFGAKRHHTMSWYRTTWLNIAQNPDMANPIPHKTSMPNVSILAHTRGRFSSANGPSVLFWKDAFLLHPIVRHHRLLQAVWRSSTPRNCIPNTGGQTRVGHLYKNKQFPIGASVCSHRRHVFDKEL